MHHRAVLVTALLLCPLAAGAQLVPLGGEFHVSNQTAGTQNWAAVAGAGETFVVSWTSPDDGDGAGVFARRYDSAGQPLGAQFQVNTHTPDYQGISAVAGMPGGAFVVTWISQGQDGSDEGVFARRFDSAGQAVGTEFQVNSYTTGHQGSYSQGHPAVAAAADGSFVIAWISEQDGDGDGVFAQRFNSAGTPAGSEFQVNTHTLDAQYEPNAAAADDGAFVIVWSSRDQDGDGLGVFAQRFDSAGSKVGSEIPVNGVTAGDQAWPVVAADPSGSFVVAWRGADSEGHGTFARRFDSDGQALGTEFQVNTHTAGNQGYQLAAAGFADGGFIITWESVDQDGDNNGIFAQRYSSAGTPIGGEFQVNTQTVDSQGSPAVGTLPNGGFLVAWQDAVQDGDGDGIYAQLYGSPAMCGDGTVDPGEPCDDGNPADGDGCDSNCTATACGNGIITGTEACDDGNTADGDGCSSTCADTALPENASDPELTAGETLTSDSEADGATPDDPVESSITLPAGTAAAVGTASATIAEVSGPGPSVPGYAIFGQQVQIDFTCAADCPTAAAPLILSFRIDASRVPPGVDENTLALLRDGVVIAPCSGPPGTASPDPCVDQRVQFGDGDLGVTILTSLASEWSFARAVCSAAPMACAAPGKALFSVKQALGDPSATKLIWKWLKGSIGGGAFGDPTAGTGFSLCVYDGGALVESHSVAGGGNCGGGPCWKPVGTSGFKYKNPDGNDAGISKVLLKSGAGKAKILVKGKGEHLTLPASDPIYGQAPDVTVQLVSSAGGDCWQAVFPAAATASDAERFKDKVP